MVGWKKLINSALLVPEHAAIALKLHNLLTGKQTIPIEIFRQNLTVLFPPEELNSYLGSIQTFLFKTIESKSCQNAAVLSPNQKQMIADWHQQYFKEIQLSIAFFTTLLKDALENERKLNVMFRSQSISE